MKTYRWFSGEAYFIAVRPRWWQKLYAWWVVRRSTKTWEQLGWTELGYTKDPHE